MSEGYTAAIHTIHRKRSYSAFFLTVGLTVVIAAVFGSMPQSMVSTAIFGILGVCGLVILLYVSLGRSRAHTLDSKAIIFKLTLLIWGYVLISEQLFDRVSDPLGAEAIQGSFVPQAYGETLVWVVSFLFLVFILLPRPEHLRRLFTGSQKWVSLFAVLCVLSVVYTPAKLYALGWSFKLLLVVLLITVCSNAIDTLGDIVAFFNATVWAFVVLAVVPVVIALWNPVLAFDREGRLNANPDALSERAGSLLVMALMLYSLQRKGLRAIIAFVGALVMMLSLGKTGIIAGVLSTALFFLLQKKIVSSFGMLLGMIVLGVLLVTMVSPLTRYVESYQGVATVTGRTAIWNLALPAIRTKPILGHGYLASHFLWLTDRDPVARSSHLHNGFLDVLYNNGAVGLALILLMHVAILRHLFHSISRISAFRKRPGFRELPNIRVAYILTSGSLALYLNLLINGLFGATFGGRATSSFELFLAVFMVADRLAAWTDKCLPTLVAPKDSLVPLQV